MTEPEVAGRERHRSAASPLEATVDRLLDRLRKLPPSSDPLLGPCLGQLQRVLLSAVNRDGWLIQAALLQALQEAPKLTVLDCQGFWLSREAEMIAGSGDLERCRGTRLTYVEPGVRRISPDLVVHRRDTGLLILGESKRAASDSSGSRTRSLCRTLCAAQMLLHDWGRQRGIRSRSVRAVALAHHASLGLPADLEVVGREVDELFGAPISKRVAEHLDYARARVREALPELVLETLLGHAVHGLPGFRPGVCA